VRKGQLLARLTDFENRVQLYQAQKDLDVAKAELKRRIDKYEPSYAMYKDLIPELDKAETLDDIPEIAVQRAIVRITI
jgi:multidrug efflux pump subunit AcrA (membrane-fusion protein)